MSNDDPVQQTNDSATVATTTPVTQSSVTVPASSVSTGSKKPTTLLSTNPTAATNTNIGQTNSNNDVPFEQHCRLLEDELQALRETETRLKQQHVESLRREKLLVRRLAAKDQEIQDYTTQIAELKAAQVPGPNTLRAALLDPAINIFIQKLKTELQVTKGRLEETQNELSAWKFTPDSTTGKRLMAKCRLLYQENEELGKMTTSGQLAKLEGELALQKSFSEEVKKSQSELDDFLQELDEDVEGMQSTILFLQQELKISKDSIANLENEIVLLKSTGSDRSDLDGPINGLQSSKLIGSVDACDKDLKDNKPLLRKDKFLSNLNKSCPETRTLRSSNRNMITTTKNGSCNGNQSPDPLLNSSGDNNSVSRNGKKRTYNDSDTNDSDLDETLSVTMKRNKMLASGKQLRRSSVLSLNDDPTDDQSEDDGAEDEMEPQDSSQTVKLTNGTMDCMNLVAPLKVRLVRLPETTVHDQLTIDEPLTDHSTESTIDNE